MSRAMIIITSAAIGGGIGYVVGNLLADKYANEDIIIDNETEEETNDDDEEEQDEELMESDEEDTVLLEEDDDQDQVTNYTQFYKGEDMSTLHELASRYKPGEAEVITVEETERMDAEMIHKHASPIEPVRDLSQPHIISRMQYEESKTEFLKALLHYYEDDDILTDETDDIVPNAERIVGMDALTSFGELSEDPDVVYVRNPIIQGEYEIIRFKKSYSETVLGIRPAPVRPSRSVRTARKASEMDEDS